MIAQVDAGFSNVMYVSDDSAFRALTGRNELERVIEQRDKC